MYHNFIFSDVNEALPELLSELLDAESVSSRNGLTKELTHVGITLDQPWRREIVLPHRKANLAAQIAETMWVLSGRNDIEWLSHYLPRAADFSDDGKTWRAGYGPRLRSWWTGPEEYHSQVDQLAVVLERLKANPFDRRAVMSLWDPSVDSDDGKDIACNNWLSFSARGGRLDLHVAIRSNDAMWGWSGINAFEWSALQEIVAGLLGLEVGGLHFSTTSLHLYEQHFDKAAKIVLAAQEGHVRPVGLVDSPSFSGDAVGRSLGDFDALVDEWFQVELNIREGNVHQSQVDDFREPMLRSWLRVLQWYWTGDLGYLNRLQGTALEYAARAGVKPKGKELALVSAEGEVVTRVSAEGVEVGGKLIPHEAGAVLSEPVGYDGQGAPLYRWQYPDIPVQTAFMKQLCALHLEKEAAYGGSWKRRGEMLGILANIARKVDRLGGGETADETSADTAGDLFVYLAKYRTWLADQGVGEKPITGYPDGTLSDHPEYANSVMNKIERDGSDSYAYSHPNAQLIEVLRKDFDRLERLAMEKMADRHVIVDGMLTAAYRLARRLWEAEQDIEADDYPGADDDDYRGADVD